MRIHVVCPPVSHQSSVHRLSLSTICNSAMPRSSTSQHLRANEGPGITHLNKMSKFGTRPGKSFAFFVLASGALHHMEFGEACGAPRPRPACWQSDCSLHQWNNHQQKSSPHKPVHSSPIKDWEAMHMPRQPGIAHTDGVSKVGSAFERSLRDRSITSSKEHPFRPDMPWSDCFATTSSSRSPSCMCPSLPKCS